MVENPDAKVTLAANGSEVSLIYKAAALLEEDGIATRIVSLPSLGLFEDQDSDYRESVLPRHLPIFGVTAGLPSTLRGVLGSDAHIFGLNHFGASAPAKVLDEKFGFTPESVAAMVKEFVG